MTTTANPRHYATFVRHLTPTTLAAISVDLEAEIHNLTSDECALLDQVNLALSCNVGDEDAEQLRTWYRENI